MTDPKPLNKAPLLAPSIVPKAAERVWVAIPEGTSETGSVASLGAVEPTQIRRPWRSTARTVFQAVVALATLVPFVVSGVYDGSADYPAVVGQLLAVSAAVTRVMALPQVESFLRRFAPWLAAAPPVTKS